MAKSAQQRALEKYRRDQRQSGISRYEVRGLEADKELVRALAKKLAARDEGATKLRNEMAEKLAGKRAKRGGIFAALRRSPLVGADIDLERPSIPARTVDL
jgi:hypothetical protein